MSRAATGVTAAEVRRLVEAVLDELSRTGNPEPAPPPTPLVGEVPPAAVPRPGDGAPDHPVGAAVGPAVGAAVDVAVDVADPTVPAERRRIGVPGPANPGGLVNLAASTSARLAVGRAGPRPPTRAVLLFGADHAVTQDAIFGAVPAGLLEQFGLFTVQTKVSSQEEYLLRPDLGRQLDDDAKRLVAERCVRAPQVQIVVGDGLSAAAVTNNLPQIYPVIEQGLAGAGITVGTPFFVRYCRVGVMNDINEIVQADMVVLLIGERPGLGVADALSVYSGWQPAPGKNDANRDVICMITQNGGTNPLEAGAFVVEHVKTVLAHRASGVELRLALSRSR